MHAYTEKKANIYKNRNEFIMLTKVDDNTGKKLTLLSSFYILGIALLYLYAKKYFICPNATSVLCSC